MTKTFTPMLNGKKFVETVEIPHKLVAIQCRAGCNMTGILYRVQDVGDDSDFSFTFTESGFIKFIESKFDKLSDTINESKEHLSHCRITIAARPAFLFLLRMRGLKI